VMHRRAGRMKFRVDTTDILKCVHNFFDKEGKSNVCEAI